MKRWIKVVLGIVGVFAAIQLVSCERTNPAVTGDILAAADVKSVLRRSCYDCHSNETEWTWYSRVAPASWLVHRDVSVGRAALNFSEWESLPLERRAKLQKESAEEVAEGEMPPSFYTPLHPHAKLSLDDKLLLRTWGQGEGAAGRAGR
mgnify:CR=1 FL=1